MVVIFVVNLLPQEGLKLLYGGLSFSDWDFEDYCILGCDTVSTEVAGFPAPAISSNFIWNVFCHIFPRCLYYHVLLLVSLQ